MGRRVLVEAYAELAADRLLDVATGLFARQGVANVAMSDVARESGCSRATLYRYFSDRQALRSAYVDREARRIGREVAIHCSDVSDPRERVVESVVESLRRVRADPALAAWFVPGEAALAQSLADSSRSIETMVASFLGETSSSEVARNAYWLLRVIVSLLTLPGVDEEDERSMVMEFVVPVVSQDATQMEGA